MPDFIRKHSISNAIIVVPGLATLHIVKVIIRYTRKKGIIHYDEICKRNSKEI